MKLLNDVHRQCGECNACCKMFAVPEVGKHDANWCSHCVIGTGCSIYSTRPLECKLFACVWLNGQGPESFRPDRLGVMIDVEGFHLNGREVGKMHLWEMRTGALEQPIIDKVAKDNMNAGFIVVYHRMLTVDSYSVRMRMQRHLFTPIEIDMIQISEKGDHYE